MGVSGRQLDKFRSSAWKRSLGWRYNLGVVRYGWYLKLLDWMVPSKDHRMRRKEGLGLSPENHRHLGVQVKDCVGVGTGLKGIPGEYKTTESKSRGYFKKRRMVNHIKYH